MIKKIYLMTVSAVLVVLAACGPKEFNLSSATSKVLLPDGASVDSLVVNGSDGNCEIEFAPEWIEASVRDSVVTIKCRANTTGALREDVLVVKCGKSNISIPVSQYAKATRIDLPNGKEVTIPREGGSNLNNS